MTLTGLEPDTEYTWGVANGTTLVACGKFKTEKTAVVVPTVTTGGATSIGTTSATMAGTLTADGGEAPDYAGIALGTASGVYANNYNSATAPTTANPGISVTRSDLTANTLYYYKAYAHNSAGTGWASTEGSFRTTASAPSAPTGLAVTQPATSTSGLTVSWTAGSGSDGTVVVMYTSDPTTAPTARTTYTGNAAYGSAASALGGKVVYAGSGTSVNVTGLSAGTRYYVRAYGYKGTASDTPALNSLAYSGAATANGYTLATQPTAGPAVTVTAKTQNSLTLSVTKGSDAAYTLVYVRAGSALSGNPSDGTEYAANAAYGSGTPLQNGYVVLAGSGTSVTVTGLSPNTAYYIRAYAYNGTGAAANYLTTNGKYVAINDKTLATAPSTQATVSLAGTGTGTATATYTRPSSGSAGVVLVMKAGSAPTWTPTDGEIPATANAAFGSGTQVATGEYVVYEGTGGTASGGATLDVTGLSAGTHYYVRAYAYAGAANSYAYNTTSATGDAWTWAAKPSAAPTIGTIVAGGHGASIPVTAGTGGDGVLVLVKTGSATAVTPTDGTAYVAGATLSGWTVAYSGPSGTATASGLTSLTTYQVRAFSYSQNGAGVPNYYTGAYASGEFTTTDTSGPTTWATGVDGTSFLLNWSKVSGDTTGYDVQTGSGTTVTLLDEGFTTGEGWVGTEGTGNKTTAKGVWTLSNPSITAASADDASFAFFYYNTATVIQLPPLTGTVTSVTADMAVPGVNDTARGLKVEYLNGSTWTSLGNISATFSSSTNATATLTLGTPIAANGLKLRLSRMNGNTVYLYHLWVNGSGATCVKGYSKAFDRLTSGTTYTAQVRKNPDGDWSDALNVKAGVVPNTPTATAATRNSVTFTWTDAQSGAVGYMVDATVADGETRTLTCPDDKGLGTNQWSNGSSTLQWKYTGTVSSPATGSSALPVGPGYSRNQTTYPGHYLAGVAGQAIESAAFELQGASAATLAFQHTGWNSGAGTGIETSRLDVYYQLDGGEWSFLTSVLAKGTADNSWTAHSIALPAGALDGETLAVKLVAPNAEHNPAGSSGTIRGAGIQGLSLTLTAAAGKYGASPRYSLAGYPRLATDAEVSAKSVTVTGLAATTPVGFRVQALQGTAASPTAKSVWVEATGTTSAFAGPELLAASPVERYGFTANWTADAAATGGYQIEWTRCGGGAADTTVSTCANGSLATSGDGVWRYIQPAGSLYPKWEKGSANKTVGHNMIVGVSPASPSPAVASPDMDFRSYTGGYVEFSHWSRHATLFAPDAQVTLWYRTSTDGSTWGSWTEGATTANLTSGATIVTEQLPIPAGAAGQAHVQIKLSTEHSLPSGGGHANIIPAEQGDSTYTGPLIKDIVVHGTSSGTPDYDTCAEGRSGIVDVAAGTTLKAFTGLAAGTPYYYHVRSVVSGSPDTYSDWSEGQVTTLAPMGPPEEVWAENIRQKHMTVAWSEADGADSATLYKYQVSGCSPSATPTVTAVAESPTNTELTVDADWSYIGGGTLVGAETVTVGGSTLNKASEETYVESAKESYPVWAGNKGGNHPEHSLVLAGLNSPGLESAEFSTVGASAGSLSFGHGRWYAQESGSGAATVLTLYYSVDGGDSWTQFATAGNVYNKSYAYNNLVTHNLPDAAMGHAHVKVRLVAEAATVGKATTDATTYHALGAAVTAAKVTLTKPTGNYTGGGCVIASGEGLTADQLSAELSGLTANSTYYFRVAASDGVLVGGSAQYGAWVESMAKTLAVPAAPASAWVVPESIGRHAMTVQWDEAAGAESYVLRVYSNSGRTTQVGSDHPVSGTTYTVTGLSASTHYYFSVQSIADGCESSGVATCDDSTSATLAVTGFCVTNILDTSLSVKWDNVADTTYTLQVGTMETTGTSDPLYETIECPATTLARSDAGNGWFYLGGNANYPKYYVNSDSAKKAEDQGHVLSYISGGTPGIQSRWFSTFGAKSATVEFLHGRWFNGGANSALQVFYSIDGGTTWASAGDIPAVPDNSVPGGTSGGEKTVTRLALPARALGQRMVAIRLVAPSAAAGGSYGYGAEIKDLKIKIEAHPNAANVFSGTVSGGIHNLTGLTVGQRYWFNLTASETYGGSTYTAEATQTAATRQKTTGVVQSQGFEGPSANGALDTTAWGYQIKYFTVGNSAADAVAKAWATGYPVVEVVDGENPLYGDRALRMSGSSAASVYGVVEFLDKNFGSAQNVAVTIPFAVRDLASGENLWVCYSTDGGSTWSAPTGLDTLTKSGMTLGKIARGGSDTINQNWPYNHGVNETTRPGGDAYTFEVRGASRIAVRVVFCGNSGGAKHYCYIDEVKLERLATPPSAVSATANAQGSVNLGWTPAGGQSVVIIRGQDQRNPPASVDLGSLPKGYEVVTNATGGTYWVNTADPASAATGVDSQVTGGWKYFYYFYGALANGDGTYTLSKECVSAEAIVKGMVEAIASQGWDGWDVHPWGYKKGRTTNPGQAGDCGYWAYNKRNDTLPYEWAHFVEGSWEYDGDARGAQGAKTYAYYYGADKTYGPAGRTDPDSTQQLGVSSYTNYFGTNCFRLSGGSGWVWSGTHTYTNNNNNVRTVTDPYINTNNAAIQFDTVDLSGYKNVQFSFHYAQTYSGGGNYMHVAISTNGNGENGSWMAYDNKNDAGWRQVDASRDYGLQLQTMTEEQTGGNVDFYDESRAPYGNPFVLNVPDSVTQMTVRLTFFDTTGFDQRKALVFVDEVRLTGEVAIEAPKPYISEIGKDRFMVHWAPVTDATSYDVQVTEVCDESVIKLAQAFPVNALPKDWTKSDTGVNFPKTASRLYSGATGDHDHGLSLTGQGGWLTSPEVGGSTNLHFWAKANNGSGSSKLIVQAKGADEPESAWETLLTKTCAQLTATWTEYELALPNRQWTQVRFMRSTDGTGDIYVDDAEFHGEGVYTGTLKLNATGVSATNQVVTGLESGHRYLAHVRAVGAPAGVVVRSAWGETADWTSGDFTLSADGFEMTRSTWANPGSGIIVMAVNDGKAYSEVTAPTGDPAVGTAFGEGVVIAKETTAKTGAGFEHIVPYDDRVDARTQRYVVYWKRGSYWEGRLETNAVLETYRCAAADSFSVTNATSMPATGTQAAFNTGKGWAGAWNVETVPWSGAWAGQETRHDSRPYGLLETNQLWGTGGNMLVLYPTNTDKKVEIKRQLATPLSKSSEWWGMFTMKLYYTGDNKWAGIQLLDSSGTSKASIGKLWNGKKTGIEGSATYTSNYEIANDGDACVIVFKWDGTKMWLKTFYVGSTSNPQWAPTASAPAFDGSVALSMDDIHAIRLVAQNGSGVLYPVWFDEIRIGDSWGSLVGKDPVAPRAVQTATATMDGKEMIRLAWEKPAAWTDTSVVPNVEHPAATRVVILEKDANAAFTAAELALKSSAVGTSVTADGVTARVIYSGDGTELEHVVLHGTSHRYAFYSYADGVYASTALEVSTDSVTGAPLTMDRYGAEEYVNPFSYTNSVSASGSGYNTEWRGGNGFTNAGASTVHFWATGDGQNGTTANAATWTPVKPSAAPAYMSTEIPNYKESAGNVMKVTPAVNTSAALGRTLAQDWGGEAGKTFFVAYRVAYQYEGQNKWVGLKLIDNSGSHRGVFIGKPGTSDASKNKLLSIDPGGGLGIGWGNYELNGGGTDAYVVVAKVRWTGASTVDVFAMAKYGSGSDSFPENEPNEWNAEWRNMTFAGVHMIELLAGGSGSDVTPGDVYFDEIRFGGSWDDLLGPKVPTDVWMAGISDSVFLGDYVTNNITSQPSGPGQSAKHLLSSAADPRGTAAWAAAVNAGWVRNFTDGANHNTEWIATNQFHATGTLYAYGSATGDGETVYSQDHSVAAYQKNTYTVSALPAPVLTAESDVGYKVPLSWTRGTSGGRTFPEVMVIRYDSSADNIETLLPEQGKAYFVGDRISVTTGQGNTRWATVIYRGTATEFTNRPCSNGTRYYYAAFTVNNNYYSPRATANAMPNGGGGTITIDGDPNDWVGTPSEIWNTSAYSEGELIWTDKLGDERVDKPECASADITEFRVKADETNVYFLVRLNGGTATAPTNAHIAVGVDTRLDPESAAMNWLADEANTFTGPAYYSNSAAIHFPAVQMAVHWVGAEEEDNKWKVELFGNDSAEWHAPVWWMAASPNDGTGTPQASADPCVEWAVPRSALGLDGVAEGVAVTGRFTVASFLNSGSWNNQAAGVIRIESNSCAAVDALAIAPYGANDKDYALSAWDEGLKDKNVDFWMDARFGQGALLADTVPGTPANPVPATDSEGHGNPELQWSLSSDAEGFVTGWLLEVADTPNFGGTGGHTENGSVLYRVNVELTPAMAALLAADPTRKITYKPATYSKEFWWRVRARDNAGQLSAGTIQHYTVTGKQDNDGPVATLKYVGSDVDKFLNNAAYRAEVEKNGEAYSIMDSEFGSGAADFGFVIEWYDINGVYATNHMRGWVAEYDGTDDCGEGHSKWPAGKRAGDFAWNILATNSDGTAFGRVSPNWDLMMVNTNRTTKPADVTVHASGGTTKTLEWVHQGGSGEKELLIPDAMGVYQPAEGWVIQWGYDDPFDNSQTLQAYEGATPVSCNGVQYLTNYVSGVFGLPEYDPEVDLYLTLSAEDCCIEGAYGEEPWYPWPPSTVRDNQGSYRGLSCNEYPGEANENVLTGGWCADGPNPARNVTVNQLIRIPVKDNDVVPPIPSTNRWGKAEWSVGETRDDRQYMPSMVVSTQEVSGTTWANLSGKLLPRQDGFQRDILYQLTDAAIPAGQRLSFLFNVYDDYVESGTQYGTSATGARTGWPAGTRSLTNSALVVKSWNPDANEGAGAWVASAENTAQFSSSKSSVFQMNQSGSTWTEEAGARGNGPNTVLTWDMGAITEESLTGLFGMANILEYIGAHSDGVTNLIQLHAWDNDDNRPGDQANAEITFGRMLLTDDDATPPESPGYTFYGSGTNFIRFGSLAGWTFSGTSSAITSTATNSSQMMKGMTASRVWAGVNGTALPDRTSGTKTEGVYWANNRLTMSQLVDRGRYFEFDLAGLNETRWVADTLVFNNYVSSLGPTTLELEYLSPNDVVTKTALNGAELSTGWSATGACEIQTVAGFDRFKMASAESASGQLTSASVSTAGKAYARVSYRAGAFGAAGSEAPTTPTLTVTVKRNGSTTVGTVKTIKLTDFEATAAAENYRNWNDYVIDLPLDTAGSTDTYTVEWAATGVNGSLGFLLRDVSIRTEGNFTNPRTLVTMTVPKEEDENKGAGNYKDYTETTVTMMWSGQEIPDGATMRFRLYAYGTTDSRGTWGIKDMSIHGISYEPKGHEINDADMRYGHWTNALEVIDGEPTGYDTVQSGLWIADDGESYAQYTPRYTLNYPAAYGEHPGGEVVHDNYSAAGITLAAYTYAADPVFTNSSSGWTLGGSATRETYDHAKVGDKVLKLPANGSKSSATQTRTLARPASGVTGATISGNISLRALSTTAEGVDNAVDLTLEMLNASDGVIDTRVYNLEANRMVGWREIVLDPWSVIGSDIAKVRVTIAQHNAGGSEVYADDVELQMALWGTESDSVSASDNGKPGAKFRLSTRSLAPSTDVPLSSDATKMTGSGSTEYTLVSTVYDYDHDRTADASCVSVTNSFSLYDDDEEAPKLGSRFGGSLSARVGNGTNAKYADSGTAVNVHVTDRDLAEAYRANSSARLDLDIDAYDFSGWGVIGLDLEYVGTTTQVYTNGGSANFLTFAMTNNAGTENATQPSATNTLGAAVSAWWNRSDVQAEFAKTETDARRSMAVRATISDWDDDRLNDSLTLFDSRAGKAAQAGLLSFLDSDSSVPRYKGKAFNFENFFIGTNSVSAAFDSGITKGSAWTGKEAEELRKTEDTDPATAIPAEAHIYTNKVYTVYDGELRRTDKPFYIMANLGDSSGGARGQYISGVQQGDTLTQSATDAFGNTFTVTNTSAVIYRGETVVSNLFSHWSSTYSGAQNSTRSVGGAVAQTWLWATGMSRDDVSLLLPSTVVSNDLAVKFDVWDADTDRPEDQLNQLLTGPALRVLDDDTTPPGTPSIDFAASRGISPDSATPESASWTNDASQFSLIFTPAEDGMPAGWDVKRSGVAEHRIADEWTGGSAGMAARGSVLTTSPVEGGGGKVVASLGGAGLEQGLSQNRLYAVDADNDRAGDALASATPAVFYTAFDRTKPTPVGQTVSLRVEASVEHVDDPTSQFDVSWPAKAYSRRLATQVDIGGDDPDDTYYPAGQTGTDVLSPWATYRVYYGRYNPLDVPADDNVSSETACFVYTNFIATKDYLEWPYVCATNRAADPMATVTNYDGLARAGTTSVRLFDLDFDEDYVIIVTGVDKAGNEGPAGLYSWATNNTIRFALTQGMVRARSGVDKAFPNNNMLPSDHYTAALYWKAAGPVDTNSGGVRVTKEYDLIFRDRASFDEDPSLPWTRVGTVQSNWFTDASGFGNSRGTLRFFRASYKDRWQRAVTNAGVVKPQRPLVSEEVYSMDNVVLSEGVNNVSLQGVPYTNTFAGVFGTDPAIWPAGSTEAESVQVRFYSQSGSSTGAKVVATEGYWLGSDGKWRDDGGTLVTDVEQPEGFFRRPFQIYLPEPLPTAYVTTNAVDRDRTNAPLNAMVWHPIMQVPTNGTFSSTVVNGTGIAGVRYSPVALNLPVSVGPGGLGLPLSRRVVVETVENPSTEISLEDVQAMDPEGTHKVGDVVSANGFVPGLTSGDRLYVLDTETKAVRNGSTIYYGPNPNSDTNVTWRFSTSRAPVPDGFIKPNDMIVIISRNAGTETNTSWTWTYTPSNYYRLPTRHMGVE